MIDKLAKILSIIFHPLIMPSVGVLILLNSGTYIQFLPYKSKLAILSTVAVGTLLVPLAFIPIYIYRKVISGVEISQSRERFIPLFITCLLYYFTYYFLKRFSIPGIIISFLLASGIAVFSTLVINIWWKVSLHMMGIGGLTGMLVALLFKLNANVNNYIIITILLAGIIGTARLKLEEHSPAQIYTGYFIGLVIACCTVLLY